MDPRCFVQRLYVEGKTGAPRLIRYLREAASQGGLASLYEAMADGLIRIFGACTAHAYLVSRDQRLLWLLTHRCAIGKRCPAPRRYIALGEPHVAAMSVATCSALRIEGPWERAPGDDTAGAPRAVLAAPLIADGRALGTLACMFDRTADAALWEEFRCLSEPLGAQLGRILARSVAPSRQPLESVAEATPHDARRDARKSDRYVTAARLAEGPKVAVVRRSETDALSSVFVDL